METTTEGRAGTIPCSVSLLTLNSREGLTRCLESLKDMAEIIVCDGNSTDGTQEVALSHGARVIRQYDTDEPAVPCVMDKAAVRAKAMSASTLPWRFFMDSDDGLSPEVVEEIRSIVSQPHPAHFVWRMRSRVFVDGKLVKYYSSYPAYQVRLVHESVGAHFRGNVHERLEWNEKKFPVGTMKSFYDFHWSQERVAHYWSYWHSYIQRELQTASFPGFWNFFYWNVYRRLRTLAGYIFWRLPRMYVRYGFKETMPLSLELTIVRYHVVMLYKLCALYIKTRTWAVILVETLKGKDINRILSNLAVRDKEAYGRVLDIGGREGKSSYWRYLKHSRWYRTTTLDIDAKSKPDVVLNIDEDQLPFSEDYFDTVLLFNVLEHLHNADSVLLKIARVLRRGGTLVGVVPFMVGVHPDPHDYRRYTDEGLEDILTRAGFSKIRIQAVGRGPFLASYYQTEFLIWPRVLKLLFLPAVYLLDALVLSLRPKLKAKFPLSYTFTAQVE